MTRRRAEAALKSADIALTDWVRSYAPEFCDSRHLQESSERVYAAGGTLAYIASVRAQIKSALAASRGKQRKRGRG